MAKETLIIGMTGEQLISALNSNFEKVSESDPYTFNVRDYGAGNGVVDDATVIQSVIDAASVIATTKNNGAKVLIPNGEYLLKSVMTLKTNVSVVADNNCYFCVESSYTGAIWQGDVLITRDAVLEGGRYVLNENTTFFKHTQANGGYFLCNRFSNVCVENCKAVFDLIMIGNGWFNANNFENLNIWRAVKFMSNTGNVIDGNFFSNITFQTWAGKTTSVFENITGRSNQFVNIKIWDFNQAFEGAYVIHLADTSVNNIIIGVELIYGFEDLGTGNYVFSNGQILTT